MPDDRKPQRRHAVVEYNDGRTEKYELKPIHDWQATKFGVDPIEDGVMFGFFLMWAAAGRPHMMNGGAPTTREQAEKHIERWLGDVRDAEITLDADPPTRQRAKSRTSAA